MASNFQIKLSLIVFSAVFASATTVIASDDDAARRAEEQARIKAVEDTVLANEEEFGQALSDFVTAQMGTDSSFIEGREAEFGRAVGNILRTYQFTGSYEHQANDALVKSEVSWIEFAYEYDMLDEALESDLESKRILFSRGKKKIAETGDLEIALNFLTLSPCFRDLTVAEGFTRVPGQISYVSPYGRSLSSDTLKDTRTITEQKIHELWTMPRIKAYGDLLGVEFQISEWDDEERLIVISVMPTTS